MANIVITAANVTKSFGTIVPIAVAAEAIVAGQSIYVDTSGAHLADASVADKPAAGVTIGIALGSAALGQIVPYLKRPGDKIAYGAGVLVAGQYYVVSNTAGAIMPAADLASGNYSVLLGYAEDTSVLVLLTKSTGVALA